MVSPNAASAPSRREVLSAIRDLLRHGEVEWLLEPDCVACALNVVLLPEAIGLLTEYFQGRAFSARGGEPFPSWAEGVVDAVGGLRERQVLLCGEEPGLWAMVWPWDDGVTATLRIGVLDGALSIRELLDGS